MDINTSDSLDKIGKVLKRLRKERTSFNYKVFAEKLNISQNTYLRIEKGNGDFNLGSLIAVLNYYEDIKLSDLFIMAGL
ncbi:helix-turn-helix domain-containing protein [Saccharicrinis sp. FJH54]|uniref:helix-turn-helix domain-containing protein n=1 Tax=Saccharicrinis sp. FJH54 TaxID=3344665 RepID=UPI0035D3F865